MISRRSIFLAGNFATFLLVIGTEGHSQHDHSAHRDSFSNFADPATHPYADSTQGRESYRYRNATRNEHRLYDFYSRQADYYLSGAPVPEIIPAFPGLDGGSYGHWGARSEMGNTDAKWDRMQIGSTLACIVESGEQQVRKGLAIKVGNGSGLSTVFDTESLTYRSVWKDGFLDFPEARWGLMGIPKIDGEVVLDNFELEVSEFSGQFIGYHHHGDKVALEYEIDKTRIIEMPLALSNGDQSRFLRIIEFPHGSDEIRIPILKSGRIKLSSNGSSAQLGDPLAEGFYETAFLSGKAGTLFLDGQTLMLEVLKAEPGECLFLELTRSSKPTFPTSLDTASLRPSSYLQGGPTRWGPPLPTPNLSRHSKDGFSIETLGVPLGNHFLSPMFLSGLDFFENGDAAISTFYGDVWIVSNISMRSGITSWKRIATGLHQPLGLTILDGVIHTVGRDQVTALHDLNGDQEIDFYQTVFNDFETEVGSHDFNACLQTDDRGNLYFASPKTGVVRLNARSSNLKRLAGGVRNPNGIGVSPSGRVIASAQEGEWTPASMIVEASKGGNYGWNLDTEDSSPSPPLAYIPRGLDHSSGAQVFVSSPEWEPYRNTFLGLSYGACSFYQILDNEHGQGAILPLSGEFLAGTHRARFNPIDGQLYVIGTQGWGSYAQYEGSFERVRLLDSHPPSPSGFRVFANGIQIYFPSEALAGSQSSKALFCQQWNYRYSSGYGSPEYSVRNPQRIGHDPVSIKAVHVSDDGASIFIETPDLQAAMQTHLRYTLRSPGGQAFSGNLFLTALDLENSYDPATQSVAASQVSKRLDLSAQVARPKPPTRIHSASAEGRLLQLHAVAGLSYDRNSLSVSAGERITLRLINLDTMPHNWILGESGSYEQIGQMADSLANNPEFAESGYIPDNDFVLASIPSIPPEGTGEVNFTAPLNPGTYPYLCTFPGHWKIMKGTLIVY